MAFESPPSFVRRSQLTVALALGLLFFVWTLRWQASIPRPEFLVINRLGTGNETGADDSKDASLSRPANHLAFDLSDPDAPFVGWPLRRVCDEVEAWTPGVVFLCDNNFGGVGNVRNFILTCVRYAIEAGASGMVMPRIKKRADDDIKDIFSHRDFRPFSYLFDERNFRTAMGENCPQMTLYDDLSDVPNVRYKEGEWVPGGNRTVSSRQDSVTHAEADGNGNVKTMTVLPEPDIEILDPRQFGRDHAVPAERCDFAELDHHTDRFGEWFHEWVTDPLGERPPASANNTRLFRGTDAGVLWQWPVYRDGPELANTFGGLCKFNPQVMRLGKKALASMQAYARDEYLARIFTATVEGDKGNGNDDNNEKNKHHYEKRISSSSSSSSGGSQQDIIRRHGDQDDDTNDGQQQQQDAENNAMSKFVGIHLRSEADALSFWPTYEMQEQGYLGKVRELGPKAATVAYVASGNATETEKLRAAAAKAGGGGLKLVSKTDLLDEEGLRELGALSWDQQGLVDYVVLAGAEYFLGNSRSSFSISVSLKRHLRAEGLYARPFHVRRSGWQRNFLVGPLENYYEHWVFIWDAMWP